MPVTGDLHGGRLRTYRRDDEMRSGRADASVSVGMQLAGCGIMSGGRCGKKEYNLSVTRTSTMAYRSLVCFPRWRSPVSTFDGEGNLLPMDLNHDLQS